MPLCTLHLVKLHSSQGKAAGQDSDAAVFAARRRFLQHLVSASASKPLDARLLAACVVRRAVIVATNIDHVTLNSTQWDLMLLFTAAAAGQDPAAASSSSSATPLALASHPATRDQVQAEYVVSVGIPSRLVDGYVERTKALSADACSASPISLDELQSNPARSVARYAPRTSQNLEWSPDLLHLIESLDALADHDGLVDARGPVQQLNLLSFNTSAEDKERYYRYGKGFADAAAPFGGEPKIMGLVVNEEGKPKATTTKRWDEVSLVNYHSLSHFAGMAASETYQDINRAYRLPSLHDTTIICTQEVDLAALRARVQVSPSASQAHL